MYENCKESRRNTCVHHKNIFWSQIKLLYFFNAISYKIYNRLFHFKKTLEVSGCAVVNRLSLKMSMKRPKQRDSSCFILCREITSGAIVLCLFYIDESQSEQ